ncbi:MAG: endonuclease domain-containing protein [Defluviitaleaceae bacterium]|nr:endonuclease domain-containing protein [Defluviitaleaceae bacterium]
MIFWQNINQDGKEKRPLVNYIVDFFCHQAKLVIEVDKTKLDAERHRCLTEDYGLRVLYINSFDIMKNFHLVCGEIQRMVLGA